MPTQANKTSFFGFFFEFTLLAALTACSTTGKQPQWVDNPSADYPAQKYLSAVASADDTNTAANRAIANLAKIFEVSVSDVSMDFSSAQIRTLSDQSDLTNEQTVTRSISTQTKHDLEGAQVVQHWRSEQGQEFALAVLAKQPAADGFRKSILSLDREIKALVHFASHETNSPVAALNALKRARQAQQKRDQLNQNLRIVADGVDIHSALDSAAVENLIRSALASLKIQVQAEEASFATEMQQALGKLGVAVSQQSNLLLTGSMDLSPVEQRQAWFWLQGSYELMLTDGKKVLAKQRWPVKVSSTNADLLPQRLKDKINRSLPTYVFDLISSDQS